MFHCGVGIRLWFVIQSQHHFMKAAFTTHQCVICLNAAALYCLLNLSFSVTYPLSPQNSLFVDEKLGTKYVEKRNIPFEVSYQETSPGTPVFFVLSPGVDPLKDVESLGKKLGFTMDNGNFHNVSLGQVNQKKNGSPKEFETILSFHLSLTPSCACIGSRGCC